MNYEDKYKQALERAKDMLSYKEVRQEDMEYLFPELAESEDERIRKKLICFVENWKKFNPNSPFDDYAVYTSDSDECDRILAWLEKQVPVEHFELKKGHWYMCHRAYCCRADHLTVQEGERFQCEKDGVVKGFVIKDPEKYFIEVHAPAPMEDDQNDEVRRRLNPDKVIEWIRENIPIYGNYMMINRFKEDFGL